MRCETFHVTMSVAGCLAMQEARVDGAHHRTKAPRYPGCRTCEKGRLAREGQLSDGDVEAIKQRAIEQGGIMPPVKISENERIAQLIENERIAQSLEQAEGASGEAAVATKVCRSCPPEAGPQPVENFYRNKNTSDGLEPICRKCKGTKSRENRRKLKENEGLPAAPPSDESTRHSRECGNPARAECASPLVITVDLTRYPEIYEEIKRLAEEEDRTVEGQVRNWLRNHPLTRPAA